MSVLCAGNNALLASATMEPTATNLIPTAAVLATSPEIFVIETLISMALPRAKSKVPFFTPSAVPTSTTLAAVYVRPTAQLV